MKVTQVILTVLSAVIGVNVFLTQAHARSPDAALELRCGWIENPTPANVWLVDRDGLWIISSQGLDEQAEGDFALPEDNNVTVFTNRTYGYYCGCMSVTVDKANMRILTFKQTRAFEPSRCVNDRAISSSEQKHRPRRQIHSSGSAQTECTDGEYQIAYKNRQACVNAEGEYYFLAE